MPKRKLTRRQQWQIDKVQQERLKRARQRADKAEALLDEQPGTELLGLVTAHFGTQVQIEALEGSESVKSGQELRCHFRANIDNLVTGDTVVFRAGESGIGVVTAVEDRGSELLRPDKYGKLKPVAANIDQIIIVIAAEPPPSPDLIDRYLVAAEASRIQPILLLNKTDLIGDINLFLETSQLSTYEELGYRIHPASSTGKNGLDNLKTLLENRTSVFVGQSGVGKSSLVNALLPDAELDVGELASDGQGSHTTSTARLFHFPGGGDLIDSPGIREFGLWHIEPDILLESFIEFRPFIGHCRFRDCRHRQEPDCAILKALEEGSICQRRFDSYLNILESQSPAHY
jgi:ribosome biogenesis GTPase